MKVRYLEEDVIGALTKGEIYKVERIVDTLYEIIDEDEDHSLWPPDIFEIVEGSPDELEEYETIDD